MTKQDAYRIVYNDILNRDIGLFVGRFDVKNGNPHFMSGISTVMEFLALECSEADYEDFQKIWFNNYQKSIDKVDDDKDSDDEPADIDDDCGFDPYEGCYTYDC